MKMAGPARPAYFLNKALWRALDWIFPPTCGGCGQIGERWCLPCQQQVTRVSGPICARCGDLSPNGQICSGCQAEPPAFRALRSYAGFHGTIREALHRLKYKRDIGIGEPLSKHLIELYNELKWDIDIIAPVPLSPKRLRERGYNQSGFLARPLAYAVQKPYCPGILRRTRETQSQVGLSARERQQNVGGAFQADSRLVRGKAVLMIDDVTTTGSTISACAQALLQAGASVVFGMTLARAVLANDMGYQAVPQANSQPTISNPNGGTYGS